MRSIARTIRCRLLQSGTAERLCCAPWQAQHWDRGYCIGRGAHRPPSRRREPVTARQTVPNSLLEAHVRASNNDGAGPCQPNTFLQFRSPCQFLRCRRRPTPARQFPTSGIGRVRHDRALRPVAPRVQYLPGSRPRQRKCRSRGKCGTTSVLRRLNDGQLGPMMRTGPRCASGVG
jgi:hypothetical protein